MTPRIVLDSNVIVSGFGWSGPPARILDAALDGRLVLLTSPPLLSELRRVLAYPKLAKVIDGTRQLVDLVEASSVVVIPTRVLAVVSDESDNRILEAAVEGAADYIVSGETTCSRSAASNTSPSMLPAGSLAPGRYLTE